MLLITFCQKFVGILLTVVFEEIRDSCSNLLHNWLVQPSLGPDDWGSRNHRNRNCTVSPTIAVWSEGGTDHLVPVLVPIEKRGFSKRRA